MPSTELLAQSASAEGLSNPSVAINLAGINDWSVEMPFIDLVKNMRPMWANRAGEWSTMSNAQLEAGGHLDENGWPIRIPAGMEGIATIWDWSQSDAAGTRQGTYVLTYEGEGTMTVPMGARIISSEPGRIVFANDSGGMMMMKITETDPNGTGDHIRNVSIVRAEHEELHEAGAIFNPDWLEIVSDFRQFRFMDWMEINNSDVSEWSDRTKLNDTTWGTEQGPPVEVMVRLANEAGVDPWFTMPHKATDEYVREFATYVRDNLDPALKASIEYSNETWNGAFEQFGWFADRSVAEWGQSQPYDYYVKRATEVMRIWDDVYGAESDARLVKTLGAHNGNTWLTGRLLNPEAWRAAEPGNYTPPAEVFDAVAVTTYFGGATSTNPDLRGQLLQAIDDPNVNANEWLKNKLLDPDYPLSIPFFADLLAEHARIAESYGLRLTAYEGGQHVHHLFATDGAGEAISDFMAQFVRSPQMGELYRASIDSWEAIGADGSYMQFGDVYSPNKWGSWGFLAHLDDSTPRGDALYEANAEAPWWESRGGVHFQDGAIRYGDGGADTLTGTVQEDYLIGRGGADTLVGGKGDDGLHGGAGTDTAVFSGRASDYVFRVEGDGVRAIGPDGSDLLIEVEFAEFETGGRVAIADLVDGAAPPAPEPDPAPAPEPDPTPEPEPEPDPDPAPAPEPQPQPEPSDHSMSDDVFFIGHSLVGPDMPAMLADLLNDLPGGGQVASQRIPGASLSYNWQKSFEVATSARRDLPSGDYEVVVMTEAVPLSNSLTWNDSFGYAKRFYDLAVNANPDARVYMYESWHDLRSGTGVDVQWDDGDNVPWRQRLVNDLPRWESIVDHVNANRAPGQPEMMLIPAGQAMGRLHDEIEAGRVPGIDSIRDLFKDDIHLNDLGNYFLTMVQYSAIYGKNPSGLPRALENEWGADYSAPSPSLAAKLQAVAWNTVTDYPGSGVGDSGETPQPQPDPDPEPQPDPDPAPGPDPDPAPGPDPDPAPGPNAAPDAVNDPGVTVAGEPVTIDVLANDTDANGDNVRIAWVHDPENGTARIVNGTILYTPDAGFEGLDRFFYGVSDGRGGTDKAKITVRVDPAQDGPGGSTGGQPPAPDPTPTPDPEPDPAPAPSPSESGFAAEYFRLSGGVSSLSQIDFSRTPDATETVAALDVLNSSHPFWNGGPADNFAARYTATLNVESGGRYTFRLTSDDGSALYIDGQRVVNHDGLHSTWDMRGSVDLSAGSHDIEVRYFESRYDQSLRLEWAGPDTGGGFEVVSGAAVGIGSGGGTGGGSAGDPSGGDRIDDTPGAVEVGPRGDYVDGAEAVWVTASSGVRIQSVGFATELGKELGLPGGNISPTYVVYDEGYRTEIDGAIVRASYWTVMANKTMRGGAQIEDSALDGSLRFASVLEDVGAVGGTDHGDVFLGAMSGDFFMGGGGDDEIDGRDGDDILMGEKGADRLIGGEGDDTFVFAAGHGADVIADFERGDALDLREMGFSSRADALSNASVNGRGDVTFDFGGGDSIRLAGVGSDALDWVDVFV